jgi:signal transduction histidine kinase
MRRQNSVVYHIIVFTIAQLAWFSLLGLWIYWYVSNYILLTEVGEEVSSRLIQEGTHVAALVSGIILLIAISVGMSLIFIYLNRQTNLTRMYDNFIGNVTHELKSPLSSIQLHLETMGHRNITPETRKQFVDLMLRDAQRLNDLITSILDISGLEQKKIAYTYQIYEADDVVRKIIQESSVEFRLQEEELRIHGQLNGQVVADRRALKIVINNLIDNAIKYSEYKPELTIELATSARKFHIAFTDKGIGISRKDQKRIFRKFQRIYDEHIPNVKGTGLGLYWVREIIRSHGGAIMVSSEGKNTGSTFSIELPVYQAYKKRYIKRLLRITQRSKQIKDFINE